jgi:CRISPR-associated protein Csb2
MPLIIEQFFPQGRFHATRWRENPFADSYGEWPPSPWRLLRTLSARWFQYSRETGDQDQDAIGRLLKILASKRPQYLLPSAIKGPTLKQYQPISEHSWSDPSAGSGAVKRAKTTLFPDGYFVIDPKRPIFWQWPEIDLSTGDSDLLAQLLARVTYFGRAESRSHLALSTRSEQPNCVPAETGGNAPVLCFAEGSELDLGVLLCDSDKGLLESAPVPPGTEWVFYRRSGPSPKRFASVIRDPLPHTQHMQFALGGHVLPKIPLWIKVTERFRGRVLREFSGSPDLLPILSGKEAEGQPLRGAHDHAFFLLWPDEDSETPSRLIVWRRLEKFHADEADAMMLAGRRPISWTSEREGWTVQLVPLPNDMPLPKRFNAKSRSWESATPFVRPHNRHFRRSNGKFRAEEEPEAVCEKLIEKIWGIRPIKVEKMRQETPWVKLHETAAMRRDRRSGDNRTPHVGPGHYLRVTFAEEFQGPLIVGDSAHFGLGVFRSA